MSNSLRFIPRFKKDPKIAEYSNQRLLYMMRHEENRALRKMYALHIYGNDALKLDAYRAALRGDVEQTFFSPSPPLIPKTERDKLLYRSFLKYDDFEVRKAIAGLIDDIDLRNYCMNKLNQNEDFTTNRPAE